MGVVFKSTTFDIIFLRIAIIHFIGINLTSVTHPKFEFEPIIYFSM